MNETDYLKVDRVKLREWFFAYEKHEGRTPTIEDWYRFEDGLVRYTTDRPPARPRDDGEQ